MNLLFRPDSTRVLDQHVQAAEVAYRDDNPAKTADDVLSGILVAAEVPQDAILTAEDKRQSSLLLEEAAWHIEEVARHMDSINEASSQTFSCNFGSALARERSKTCIKFSPNISRSLFGIMVWWYVSSSCLVLGMGLAR